jgi:CRISPR-associated endonuclease/helicase Cas3
MWYTHSLQEYSKSEWHLLAVHLRAVSELSSYRAEKFGGERAAALAGLLHDLGKYTDEFQARLERLQLPWNRKAL